MSNMKNISLYINYIAQNLEEYDIFLVTLQKEIKNVTKNPSLA